MKIAILGESVQGLIAACVLGKAGIPAVVANFSENNYEEFVDGYKTGPVTHLPLSLPYALVDDYALESHGFDVSTVSRDNPFEALPFYDGLKSLLQFFKDMDDYKPAYKEKAWRDAWATFELGRILAQQTPDIQNLFAQSTTASLNDVIKASGLDEGTQANIMAHCLCGSKTDPNTKGTAASLLSAMIPYGQDSYRVQGSLHSLVRALKDVAMGFGVSFYEGQSIQSVQSSNGTIDKVIMDGGDEIEADYFILDHDPVTVFEKYMAADSLPPAFRNRVTSAQNTRESVRIGLVLSELPDGLSDNQMIASSVDYIAQARNDMKKDGGSQLPFMSVVNVTRDHPEFAAQGHHVIELLAHYFEPQTEDDQSMQEAQILVAIQALDKAYPGISDHVVHSALLPVPSQGGQANFTGAMPLLQLFKIFFGHHAIGYDIPYHNLLVAGYGAGACAHYHVYNGGMRVANLLQSLNNDDKNKS